MRAGTSLLFALLSLLSAAQDHLLFPDSAAAWTNALYYYPPPPPGPELIALTSYCASGRDTVLFDVDYKRIDTCGAGYKGAIRVLDERVFFVPKDSLREFLLYDFSLHQGDTAHDVYMEGVGDQVYVTDVRIFHDEFRPEFPGRRVIYTEEGTWVQGIGASSGLFMNSGINVSLYMIELYCMSRADTAVYGEHGCPATLGIASRLEDSGSGIHPNPTEGRCRLRFGDAPGSLRVRTVSGTDVEVPMVTSGSEVDLDLAGLAPGLYMVEAIVRGQRHVHRVIRR